MKNVFEFIKNNPKSTIGDIVKYAHELYAGSLDFKTIKEWNEHNDAVDINPDILKNGSETYSVLSSRVKPKVDVELYLTPRIYATKNEGSFSQADMVPNFAYITRCFTEGLNLKIKETLGGAPVARKGRTVVFNTGSGEVSEAQKLMQMADALAYREVRKVARQKQYKKFLKENKDRKYIILYASQLLTDMKIISSFYNSITGADSKKDKSGELIYDKVQKFLSIQLVRCLNGLDEGVFEKVKELSKDSVLKVVKESEQKPNRETVETVTKNVKEKNKTVREGKRVKIKKQVDLEPYTIHTLKCKMYMELPLRARGIDHSPSKKKVGGKIIKIDRKSPKYTMAKNIVDFFEYTKFLTDREQFEGKALKQFESEYFDGVVQKAVNAITSTETPAGIKKFFQKLNLSYERSKRVKDLFGPTGEGEVVLPKNKRNSLLGRVINTAFDNIDK